MSLALPDLFRLEMRIRGEADRLRRRWPDEVLSNPTVPAETKIYARTQREIADDFDQVGNLLVGLQGDWDRLGPSVRQGYLAAMRAYDAQKPASEPVAEDDAA